MRSEEEKKQYQSGLLNSEYNEDDSKPLNESVNTDNIQINKPLISTNNEQKELEKTPLNNDHDKIINIDDDDNKLSDNDIDTEIMETTSSSHFKLLSWLNTLDQNDKYYTSFIQRLEFGCLFEIFMLIPTVVYSFIGIAILIMIYSVVFSSILYFVNSFLCLIINEMIKRIIKRRRPTLDTIAERMVNLDGILLVKKSSSMPSGDTAQCTVFALTMIYTMNYYFNVNDITWYWMIITIPICGFERIYFGKHWIGDTFCGAFEALLICLTVCSSIGPYLFF